MEEEQGTAEPEGGKPIAIKVSREPLFGGLLFGFMILLVVATVAVLTWTVYSGWRFNQERAQLPSITVLPGGVAPSSEMTAPKESAPAMKQGSGDGVSVTVEDLKQFKATAIQVLNGGAIKGSAGTVAELLKKEGYTKVTAGNTVGDYTGTTVYFASGLDIEAKTLKETLISAYPKIETKPVVKENKETSQAPLTIILGK